ncbi:MAG: monovalent cation/H+ antiporter complex subunit F [Thermotaleaceae bacterium]
MDLLHITIVILMSAIAVTSLKFIIGKNLWEKLLALNIISSKILMFILIYAVIHKNSQFIDLALSYSIMSFIGILLITKFMLRGGREK